MKELIKEIKNKLKDKIIVVGVPTIVRFKQFSDSKRFSEFEATKGTEVIKWKDILKVLREQEKTK